MKHHVKLSASEDGIGLVLVLLLMAVVSALGSGLIAGNVADLAISNNWGHRSVAFYAADSGIEVSVRDLRSDPSWIGTLIDTATWQPVDPVPVPMTVNGASITTLLEGGAVAPGWFRFGADTPLGDGVYARQIELPPLVDVVDGDGTVTFRVRSAGRGGAIESARQELRAAIEIDLKGYSVWDNAIFAGDGQAGNQINGDVAIRGSVHVVGHPDDPATISFSGTGDIRNNYGDALDHFGALDLARLPPLQSVEFDDETVETLEAILRLEHASVTLGGTSDIGEPQATGNGFKETLDAVRSNGSVDPPDQVHTDRWDPYDATGMEFPSLDDPYVADDGSVWNHHRDYLQARSLLIPNDEISPDTASFSMSDAWGNSIDWDAGDEVLTIQGIVRVAQDLRLGKQHGNPGRRGFKYQGRGTFYVPGEIEVDGPVVPVGGYLTDGNLGLIAGWQVNIDYTAQINVMAAIYAGSSVRISKQTNIAGAVVARSFDMGTNVPAIFQVPDLTTNLPPGMPGSRRISVIEGVRVVDWYQER